MSSVNEDGYRICKQRILVTKYYVMHTYVHPTHAKPVTAFSLMDDDDDDTTGAGAVVCAAGLLLSRGVRSPRSKLLPSAIVVVNYAKLLAPPAREQSGIKQSPATERMQCFIDEATAEFEFE